MEYVIIAVLLIALFLVTLRKEEITKSLNIMSYSTETIANYFIKKHSEEGQLTPMKLLKLVYIAYGWYLASFDSKQLVSEKPVAWRHGPVFPLLYSRLKNYGKNFVKEPLYSFKNEEISEEDATFLDKIWNIYGEKDGIYLSALTHQENTPWSLTYPRGENVTISDDLIEKHYKEMAS
ncbi:Panacea domain-containing protein [Flavobacterium psychrophilum]|uniref:Panacea domain-containing protein n=1 Tax=Flavobacterium psychrophilum TaxID=96345 RepID=UPI001D0610E7|nr:type II toxin-antitoxin system antitoxin SocA domain-containing protein [Flavobacterium psychrophilum]MCB6099626.1 DUF4065 domain-containing protein [Flavobacterium psychrophilum]